MNWNTVDLKCIVGDLAQGPNGRASTTGTAGDRPKMSSEEPLTFGGFEQEERRPPASEGGICELTPSLRDPITALARPRSLIRTVSKFVSSEPPWRAAEDHLNQIDFTDLNYEDTDIMHKVIYPSEEFK